MLEKLNLDLRLDTKATGLDRQNQAVALSDGTNVEYDALIVATGAAPRKLPNTEHLSGVYTLRTLNDSLAIKQAFESRDAVTGCTVHYVTEELDSGTIISQQEVDILPDDTLDSLTKAVHQAEYKILPETLKNLNIRGE